MCDVLGLSNPTTVAERLDEDEVQIFKTKSDLVLDIPNRGLTVINESGLISPLIACQRSRLHLQSIAIK